MKGDEAVETIEESCNLSLLGLFGDGKLVFEHRPNVQGFISSGTARRGEPQMPPERLVKNGVAEEAWLHVVVEAELWKTVRHQCFRIIRRRDGDCVLPCENDVHDKVVSFDFAQLLLLDLLPRFDLSKKGSFGMATHAHAHVAVTRRRHKLLVSVDHLAQLTLFPRWSRSIWITAWEQRKFSDIVGVCSGKDYKHLEEGPIPVYGTGGFMTSVDEALSYDRDAVGIGRKGTIDKPYLLKAPFWTVDTLFYAIPKPDMDLEFVHCSFLNVDWKSKDESTGLPSLSKEAINETIALVPSFNEQSRIGEFFNDLDFLITLHQRTCPIFCFCAHGSRTNFASALQG